MLFRSGNSWPTAHPNVGSDAVLNSVQPQELAKQAIPVILDLEAALRWSTTFSTLGILEKFVMSPAAKLLGLDFVAQRQYELQNPPSDLLVPSRGTYKELDMPIDGFRIGTYRSGDGAPTHDVILEYRDYGPDIESDLNEEPISNLRQAAQELATHLKNATSGDRKSVV